MALTAMSKVPTCHNCLQYGISKAAVAQWIEYWPPKPRVVGSIPASRTTLSMAHDAHNAFAGRQLDVLFASLHADGRDSQALLSSLNVFYAGISAQ